MANYVHGYNHQWRRALRSCASVRCRCSAGLPPLAPCRLAQSNKAALAMTTLAAPTPMPATTACGAPIGACATCMLLALSRLLNSSCQEGGNNLGSGGSEKWSPCSKAGNSGSRNGSDSNKSHSQPCSGTGGRLVLLASRCPSSASNLEPRWSESAPRHGPRRPCVVRGNARNQQPSRCHQSSCHAVSPAGCVAALPRALPAGAPPLGAPPPLRARHQ